MLLSGGLFDRQDGKGNAGTGFIETLERLEEDLTDKITMPRRFKLVIDVLDAVEVPAEKLARDATSDPVLDEVRARLEENLLASAESMDSYVTADTD